MSAIYRSPLTHGVKQIASQLVLSLEAREKIAGYENSAIEETHVVDDRGGTGAWIVTFQVRIADGRLFDDVYHVSPNGIVEWTSLGENTKENDAREAIGLAKR